MFTLSASGRGQASVLLRAQLFLVHAGGTGEVMLITVYLLIFVTVLINGGGCSFLLAKLGLQKQVVPSEPAQVPPPG